MCRHLAYLGPPVRLADVVTHPPGGLLEQSWAPRRQRYGTVNADGFGIGWYPAPAPAPPPGGSADGDGRPARYRRAVPIWADANLPDLARTIRSGTVMAAVRDATPGTSQDEGAAAPFAADDWLFSHNGAVPDWTRLPDELEPTLTAGEMLALDARCDSALLWAVVLRRLRAGEPAEDVLADVTRTVAAARPGARLNLLLTDGRCIVATRSGDTLWYRRTAGDGVLVASEPDASAPDASGSGASAPDASAPDASGSGAADRDVPGPGSSAPGRLPAPEPADPAEPAAPAEPGGWQEVPEGSLLLATRTAVRITALAPVRHAERTSTHDQPLHPRPPLAARTLR